VGEAVGLIHDLPAAGDLIARITLQMRQQLQRFGPQG
jgi:hypothetical protein